LNKSEVVDENILIKKIQSNSSYIDELIKKNSEFKGIRELRLKNMVKLISKNGINEIDFQIEEYNKYKLKENDIISIEKLYYLKELGIYSK
jgi:hypothetical protein